MPGIKLASHELTKQHQTFSEPVLSIKKQVYLVHGLVLAGYLLTSSSCLCWEWKMKVPDFRCWIGETVKAKSNRSYFVIFIHIEKKNPNLNKLLL